MSDKQQMSAVKFRVREKALMLGEFTVQEMVQATGLKRESVSTEVQRMKKEGLLLAESLPESDDGLRRRVGAPPLLYRLTPDSQRRLQMAHQLTSFYLPSTSGRPTSRHYLAATRILDRLMAQRDFDGVIRQDLIRQCGEALEYAWYDENEPQESVVAAFIERERARLCYVRGAHVEAKHLFRSARGQFLNASLTEEAAQIDDYLCAVELAQRWTQDSATAELQDRIADVLAALRTAASITWADNALLSILVSLTTRLVAEPTVAVAAVAAAAHRGTASLQFDIRRGVLKMATGHLAEPPTFTEPRYRNLTGKKPAQDYRTHAHIELHRREKKEQEDRIFSRSIRQQVFTLA